jgi:hypothetical protein
MRRVAILIALLVLFAGAIRVASDAYEQHSHKALAEPDRGLRMAAMERAGGNAHGQRIRAVDR